MAGKPKTRARLAVLALASGNEDAAFALLEGKRTLPHGIDTVLRLPNAKAIPQPTDGPKKSVRERRMAASQQRQELENQSAEQHIERAKQIMTEAAVRPEIELPVQVNSNQPASLIARTSDPWPRKDFPTGMSEATNQRERQLQYLRICLTGGDYRAGIPPYRHGVTPAELAAAWGIGQKEVKALIQSLVDEMGKDLPSGQSSRGRIAGVLDVIQARAMAGNDTRAAVEAARLLADITGAKTPLESKLEVKADLSAFLAPVLLQQAARARAGLPLDMPRPILTEGVEARLLEPETKIETTPLPGPTKDQQEG